MSEGACDWVDVKREVVETRNQSIKTDNLLKNMSMDLKAFEKRFDVLERRGRMTHMAAYVLVALAVLVASYLVGVTRMRGYEADIADLKLQLQSSEERLKAQDNAREARWVEVEETQRQHKQAAEIAAKVLDLFGAGKREEALEWLGKLETVHLTPLENKLTEERFAQLRASSGAEPSVAATR
jgi:hypothetical protein